MTSVTSLQTQWLFRNKQLNYRNIIAVAGSDQGAGNDPEAFRLAFIKVLRVLAAL